MSSNQAAFDFKEALHKVLALHHCTTCGAPIKTIENTREKVVDSDYRDAQGRCAKCSFGKA